MNTPTETPNSAATAATLACPPREAWLHALADREAGDMLSQDPALRDHLDDCAVCKGVVAEVRRFQTLLLRGKAPALSAEQRASLEERIRLQSGNWTKPPRVAPWMVWGTAVAAAAAIALFVARPFADRHGEPTFAEAVKAAALPTAEKPGAGLVASAVEGDLEVASADGRWAKLRAGDSVRAGSRLRATTGGHFVVPGRFELAVLPNSELEALALGPQAALWRVRRGEVECQVEKLKQGQRFAVMFGAFRAAVVGTRFAVRQDAMGAGGQVVVSEGAVRVDAAEDPLAPTGETTTVVRAGHRWQQAGGVMSLEPIPPAPAAVAAEVEVPAAVEEVAAPTPGKAASVKPVAAKVHGAESKAAADNSVRQIVIEVPHQTMPPQDAGAPADSGARAPK